MEARRAGPEGLPRLALMKGGLIPHQADGARHRPEQVSKKSQPFFASQSASMRGDARAEFFPRRGDEQGAQQIKAHAMREARVDDGRLPLGSPGAFKRRGQREAAFVLKGQRRVGPPPFFYLWPARAFPMRRGEFVALEGPPLGVL
jgi:hypothetical protein